MLYRPLHLVHIALQPGTHVVGHIAVIKAATITIAQDIDKAVVTADEDVTGIVASIEGINVGIAGFVDGIQHGRQFGQLCRGTMYTTLGSQKLRGSLTSLFLGDGSSEGYHTQQTTQNE